jgi:hypothetical protein
MASDSAAHVVRHFSSRCWTDETLPVLSMTPSLASGLGSTVHPQGLVDASVQARL